MGDSISTVEAMQYGGGITSVLWMGNISSKLQVRANMMLVEGISARKSVEG